MDMRRYVQKRLDLGVALIKKALAQRRNDIRSLRFFDERSLLFSIMIMSYWKDHGGRNVNYKNKEKTNLAATMAKAVVRFKAVNQEEVTIKNFCWVRIVLPSGAEVSLPKQFWEAEAKKLCDR